MSCDPVLAAMLARPWNNNACRGYVIYAMENCGFSPTDIRRVVAELHEVFDFCGLEEAQQHFERPLLTLGQPVPRWSKARGRHRRGAAFLRFPTGQGELSVIVSRCAERRPTWKFPYQPRRNTLIKSEKSNLLSRPSTRTKASLCVTFS